MIGSYQLHRCSIKMESALLVPSLAKVGFWLIRIIALSALVTAQTRFIPIRINCGGPRYVDPDTKFVWRGDSKNFVTTGYKESRCSNQSLTIANATMAMRGIYCSNRFFKPRVASQHYTITVPNTTALYIVRLHFAELVRYGYYIIILLFFYGKLLTSLSFVKGIQCTKCT
jgi:DNA-directed RNA polymerase subunit RPC12/RpoP